MTQAICHPGPAGERRAGPRHDGDCTETTCEPCTLDHCPVCGYRHLDDMHPATCPTCVGRARANLEAIADLYDRLPDEAVNHPTDSAAHAPRLDVMGGNAMWMSGPWSRASEGDNVTDRWSGPEHPLLTLATWEDDWRGWARHAEGGRAEMFTVVRYLGQQMTAMAQAQPRDDPDAADGAEWPPPFDEFASDLSLLRGNLETVLVDGVRPIVSVRCLSAGCDGELNRLQHRRRPPCRHVAEAHRAGIQPRDWVFTLASYPELGAEHASCDQGGRRDRWVCRTCGRVYTKKDHQRAVANAEYRSRVTSMRTAVEVKTVLGISPSTLRKWRQRGTLTRTIRDGRGRVLYDLDEVRDTAARGGLVAS